MLERADYFSHKYENKGLENISTSLIIGGPITISANVKLWCSNFKPLTYGVAFKFLYSKASRYMASSFTDLDNAHF